MGRKEKERKKENERERKAVVYVRGKRGEERREEKC
jgi:hypothetical protein